MVRLTVDLIARGTSGYTKKKRDESMSHYLKRLTHLYLEDRGIDEVVSRQFFLTLSACCMERGILIPKQHSFREGLSFDTQLIDFDHDFHTMLSAHK